nr:MAG: capsid protein [Wenzhou rodent picorna-like virus 2]
MNTSKSQQQPEIRESVPPTDSDIHSTLDLESQSQITHFDDEVPTQIALVPDQPPVKESSDPFPDQALVNFLERPRVVHSFKWLSSAAAGSCLARIAFPDALFSCPTVWNKLQQFVYMHAGLRFTVRANGTPFHYGQLLVAWRPACISRTVSVTTGSSLSVYDNFYAVAQYPHMLVSPSSAQVTEMDVPYESPIQQLPIRVFAENQNEFRKFATLGLLEFWVLNPLRGQGATNSEPPVTVSLFASFTKPRLTGFTHAQLAYVDVNYPAPASAPTPSGMRYPVSVTQAKEDKLPYLLNTPLVRNPEPLPIAFIPAKTASTKNLSPSITLALNEFSKSNVKATKVSDHLKIWSLLQQYSVATTADLNSVIGSFYVHPGNCATGTYNSTSVQFQTKLSYISNLFNLWKGPIEYRFDFIASKFHSCRIKIAWYPPKTTEVATNDELPDAWTQIVDVQGQVSVSFTVPWLQATSWLTCNSPNAYRSSNGIIVLTLLNSLSYPSPNGPSIQVNCWTRAPNIQFAGYTNQNAIYSSLFSGFDNTNQLDLPMFSTSLPAVASAPAVPASSKATQKVTQAEECSITPVDLDALPLKPSFLGILTPNGKIFITPPLPEPLQTSVKSQRSVRLNTLLDYLSLLHLGFVGSMRLAVLNPYADVLFVPRIGNGSGIEHTFKSSTSFAERIQDARYTAGAYFPSSANSIKDITLPNYSTLAYRPTMLERYYISESFSFSLPGVDIYNFSDLSSPVTLAGADDFSFVGMAPAPLTW